MVVAWQRMTSPLKNKSKAGVERLRKAKRDNAKKEVKKTKTLAKELKHTSFPSIAARVSYLVKYIICTTTVSVFCFSQLRTTFHRYLP